MNYHLRITASYDDASGLVEKISKNCESLIIYEHTDAARVHIHGYVGGLKCSYDTIVNAMKKLCPAKADRTFSMTHGRKEPVSLSYISYMSKGKLDPKFVQGISDDVIAQYKQQGYDKKDATTLTASNGKLVKDMSPARKLQIQLMSEMVAELGTIDLQAMHEERRIFNAIRIVCKRNHYFLPKGMHKIIEFRDNLLLHTEGGTDALYNEYDNALSRRLR